MIILLMLLWYLLGLIGTYFSVKEDIKDHFTWSDLNTTYSITISDVIMYLLVSLTGPLIFISFLFKSEFFQKTIFTVKR